MGDVRTLPVWVLTGFLGSGKTTLLNRLLARPELRDSAVLVNELGAIPLDHLLVRDVEEELVVLPSGCVCCSVRGDLVRVLGDLYAKAAAGAIPPFRRVLVETTGMADPTPVLATLTGHKLLGRGYHLAGLLTTVDATLGLATLERHPEAEKQVLLADRLVLTKLDLASAEQVRAVREKVQRLAPAASLLEAHRGEVDPAALFAPTAPTRLQELEALAGVQPSRAHDHGHEHGHEHGHRNAHEHGHAHHQAHPHGGDPAFGDLRHAEADHDAHAHADAADPAGDPGHDEAAPAHRHVASAAVELPGELAYEAFAFWLSFVTQMHGEELLRVKGLLRVAGEDAPIVVQAVQHVVYPPYRLPSFRDPLVGSRVVLITRSANPSLLPALRASLEGLAAPPRQDAHAPAAPPR